MGALTHLNSLVLFLYIMYLPLSSLCRLARSTGAGFETFIMLFYKINAIVVVVACCSHTLWSVMHCDMYCSADYATVGKCYEAYPKNMYIVFCQKVKWLCMHCNNDSWNLYLSAFLFYCYSVPTRYTSTLYIWIHIFSRCSRFWWEKCPLYCPKSSYPLYGIRQRVLIPPAPFLSPPPPFFAYSLQFSNLFSLYLFSFFGLSLLIFPLFPFHLSHPSPSIFSPTMTPGFSSPTTTPFSPHIRWIQPFLIFPPLSPPTLDSCMSII